MPDEQPPDRTHGPNSASADHPEQPTVLLPDDSAPPNGPFASLQLHGTEEQIIRMVGCISRELPVHLCINVCVALPDTVWDQFPPGFLTRIQRELVREDLRLSSSAEIARTLKIGPKTINSYLTRIRKQFLSIAPEQRPVWMQAWLRRYPGVANGQRRDGAQGGSR